MKLNNLFRTMFSAIRIRVARFWTRLRLWTSPAFLRAKVFTKLRQFFTQLFDVRPRHKKDYYGVFLWLVSKRLAFAAVVVVGLLCAFYLYITLPKGYFSGSAASTIRTYKYNAIPLKFYAGTVRILAADGHLAYVGEVKKAHCSGKGTLYDKAGDKVYEGDFEADQYNGAGTLYYPGGAVRYQGSFKDNLFQGKGIYLRPNGTLEYDGEHESGHRNGQGELYNAAANLIFSGTFQMDSIVYSQFLDKPTTEAAQMYTGKTGVYTAGREYAVSMDEIGAVYSAADGSASLEGGYTVDSIYVLSDSFPVEGQSLTTVNQLTAYFGEPDYYGVSWVDLPEAAAINLMNQSQPGLLEPVSVSAQADFDGVYTVSQYDRDYRTYIYTYLRDGLLYTFYTAGAGQERFVMYAIETT